MTVAIDIRSKREAVVREHMESENRHDFDTTMGTFHHPRYEIIPTGDVYDGEVAVARYFEETRAAFPDQRNELIALHHADDAVVAEFYLKGTHDGIVPRASRRRAAPSRAGWSRCSFSRRTGWSASASTSTRRRSSASSASRTTRSP